MVLFRENILTLSNYMNHHTIDRFRKDLLKIFKRFGLFIAVTTSLTMVNFLDITLDLSMEKYYLYRTPNEDTTS